MIAEQIRVMLVDDNPDLATLLKTMVDFEPDMRTVHCLHDANSLADEVDRRQPDIVVMDLTMPGKSPLKAMQEVADRWPHVRIVTYSGYGNTEIVDEAFAHGAWGHVSKGGDPREILQAIRRVARGEVIFPKA